MKQRIAAAEAWVKDFFVNDSTGHDWPHTDRVRKQAVHIAEKEGGDLELTELAALIHDVADDKFHETETEAIHYVHSGLEEFGFSNKEIRDVLNVVSTVSFKGGNNHPPQSLEGRIVQDADRLDAIGAIGIARCFMFAGNKGDKMYDPDILPRDQMTKEEYRCSGNTAINHFHEKLLKLKDMMHTDTARRIAAERHRFMESYLQQFYNEWESLK
ncbi:HD domain-containing protein [Salisediminibacterium beveridgei]|uniref:HD/PDEase domain-containing protein n=1 Tax=Salisediminibacterium beveridgei TaxID=632773 RepID=A0A1D7QVJ9_9BACI|nr:HD domain-containing protein [Salisediminibacterium beveridgei]AOM83044.1 hypothetical protein BBEV_1683 [Salisediminibacterium beveridgei]